MHANFPGFAGLYCPPKFPECVIFWRSAVESLCSEKELHQTMVCQIYGLHVGGLSRKRCEQKNDENDKDNSDSYKQGVECWINGNHRSHGNDETHTNPRCKPRVPQIMGLAMPDSSGETDVSCLTSQDSVLMVNAL